MTTTHFVECAFKGATSQPFVLPILEHGMFVRDFAALVRDECAVPEYMDIVLCDAETALPHRGKHWILPNTALQIQLVHNAAALPSLPPPPSSMVTPDVRKGSALHVAVETITHPKPVVAMMVLGRGAIQTQPLPESLSTSLRDCELTGIAAAREAFGDQTIVHTSSAWDGDTRWLSLTSDESTRLRKAAVLSCNT